MSFLRHREIYQVSKPNARDRQLKGRDLAATPVAHRLDESPVGYSWRVALQQSPLLLHQPAATLRQSTGGLQVGNRCIEDPNLTCGLTSRAHPSFSLSVKTVKRGRGERWQPSKEGGIRQTPPLPVLLFCSCSSEYSISP